MSETSFSRRDTSRRGGFTLLEVAIALVIFVFGALAIIRIFPPALGVIQNSGDQLTAVNFNRSALARFAKQPDLVPDAVHDYSDLDNNPATPLAPNPDWHRDETTNVPVVGSVAGTPRRNNSLPVGDIQNVDTAYAESALGHFKNIVGERHIVPANGAILTQFPIASGSLVAYAEDSLSGVTVNNAGALDASNAKFSDGTSYTAPLAPATDKFYVSYRWIEGGRVWAADEEPQSSLSNVVTQGARGVQVVNGDVTVRLQRTLAVSDVDNDRGFFTVTVGTPVYFGEKVTLGQKISLNYTVKDWRWMVQDSAPTVTPEQIQGSSIQGNAPRAINLLARPLDNTLTNYSYLLFRSSDLTSPIKPTAVEDNRPDTPASVTTSTANVNRKTGQVTFETQATPAGATYGSPRVRVTYRSLDNWAHQLSVAPKNYLLNYGTASSEPWRDCTFPDPTDPNNDRRILYFKPSEAGKSVMVSYSFGTNSQIDGRIMTISEDIIEAPTGVPSSFAVGGRVSRLELTDAAGAPLSSSVTAIQKIQGISIQARTAWIDGTRFTQSSVIGYRGAQSQ